MSYLNQQLCDAAKKSDLEKVTWSLDQGARIDEPDGYGYTPLSYASDNGHLPVCEFLVGAGAKVDHAEKVRIMTLYTLYIANTI